MRNMSPPELIAMTYLGDLHVDCSCHNINSPDGFAPTTSELPMSKARFASGIGTLSTLPPEIRCLVWDYLMPEHRTKRQKDEPVYLDHRYSCHSELERPLERLSILRASQQLRDEVSVELYSRRILRLCIDPKQQGWTVKDLPEASPRDFHDTNYANFKAIQIEVHPPDDKDPGQLLRARKNIIDLVATLANSPELQRIEIVLFDKDLATWYDHDITQCSISWFDEIEKTDLEQLLGPFRYLRKVRHAKVNLPPYANQGLRHIRFAEEVERRMMSTVAFGTKDTNMDVTERTTNIRLDLALDYMWGSTAAMLRRDRFDNWYEYTRELLKLNHGENNNLSRQEEMMVDANLWARYKDYCSWNPYCDRMIQPKGYELHDMEYFDLESQWRRHYPEGIPPRRCHQWERQMRMYPWDEEHRYWEDESNPSVVYLELFPESSVS